METMAKDRENKVAETGDSDLRKAAKGTTPEGQGFYAPAGPTGGSNSAAPASVPESTEGGTPGPDSSGD